ncbi:MAG: glycosyltransferase, partial [Bacillota bacterium]|nr:glycosyltransferase [Bacillota bacterium]
MRVLLATMALELGGAETHVVSLAGALKRKGLDVEVASSGGALVEALEEAGIEHHFLPLDRRSPLALAAAVGQLRTLLRRRRYDLIHAHARIPAWVAEQARRRGVAPVALVTTYHGVYAAGWFWRRFTVLGDATIAVSEDVRDHLIRRLGARPDQVRLIPNGIGLGHFLAAAEPGGLGPTPYPSVLHVSRLSEFADTALALAQAAPELARHHPGFRLRIAGAGTRLQEVRRAAEEAARRAGYPVVEVLGARRDIPSLLVRSWVVVAVARSALEAMAAARPVIICGQGGYGGLLEPSSLPRFEPRNFTARGTGRPIDA